MPSSQVSPDNRNKLRLASQFASQPSIDCAPFDPTTLPQERSLLQWWEGEGASSTKGLLVREKRAAFAMAPLHRNNYSLAGRPLASWSWLASRTRELANCCPLPSQSRPGIGAGSRFLRHKVPSTLELKKQRTTRASFLCPSVCLCVSAIRHPPPPAPSDDERREMRNAL